MSGSGLIPYAVEPRRSAQTERADVLALIDEILEDHHFQALRDKIAGGLHERNAT